LYLNHIVPELIWWLLLFLASGSLLGFYVLSGEPEINSLPDGPKVCWT
jgi:hypothetical protein